MPFRALLAIALAATFALIASGAALFGGGDDAPATTTPQGALRPPDIPPTDFRLVDQDGRTTTLADVKGKVTIVTFLYTTCEDTCPLAAMQIRDALNDLGHDVPVLAFAVDPPRDTPERAQRFVATQRMTGRMRFLTGPRTELAKQWRAYGIRPQGDGFDHTAHVVLLDRRGVQRIGFPVEKLTPEALAHDVALLERDGGPAAP
ncbi:MAG TPA: SCO family protein [Actinomycetota bacterium]|nr:SCO family protein [Actinomycetota bacterium]